MPPDPAGLEWSQDGRQGMVGNVILRSFLVTTSEAV